MTDLEKNALDLISIMSKEKENLEQDKNISSSSSKISSAEAKRYITAISDKSLSTQKKKKNTNGSKKRQRRKTKRKVVEILKKEKVSSLNFLDEKIKNSSFPKKKSKKKKYKKNHNIKEIISVIFDFLLDKLVNATVLCLFCVVFIAIIFICFL